MPDNIGIFRLQLFKPSETFVRAQVDAFTRYHAVYIGTQLFGEGGQADLAIPARNLASWAKIYSGRGAVPFTRALGSRTLDILHAHFAIDGALAVSLATSLKIPLVTTLHGFDVTRKDGELLRSGRPALVASVFKRPRLMREGALFICISEFIRKAALARGYPSEKLLVHYIGIDTRSLLPRDGTGEEGLLVHVARLVEKKGTLYLMRAFAEIKPHHPNARLVILGDGPLRVSLEAEAQRLGIAEACEFRGMMPNAEVLAWVRKACALVVPSVTAADGDAEGFGIVNLEAGAQGVPVIAYRSGGIMEAIIHGKTGLLSDERDVRSLADNLAAILRDQALRKALGAEARRHVETNFNIHRQSARLEAIYDDLRTRHT